MYFQQVTSVYVCVYSYQKYPLYMKKLYEEKQRLSLSGKKKREDNKSFIFLVHNTTQNY